MRGAWIEIFFTIFKVTIFGTSLPVRGAWIEIVKSSYGISFSSSLPVRGAWIEMLAYFFAPHVKKCRSPCGERGLKFHNINSYNKRGASLPVRGAWIEIISRKNISRLLLVAPRAGSVD